MVEKSKFPIFLIESFSFNSPLEIPRQSASSHMARRVLVGNLYKEVKDPNLITKISGRVENSRAFRRYRDIDEEMTKEVILKLE